MIFSSNVACSRHDTTITHCIKYTSLVEEIITYDTPAYMFNVYKNQLSRKTGSRNLTGPKMLPTIWHTYMKLVTKYQISTINSCWEKCDEKYLGTDGRMDRWKDRGKTVYPPPPSVERGYKNIWMIRTNWIGKSYYPNPTIMATEKSY